MKPLETVLGDAHRECDVLKRNGLVSEASARERILRDVENALVDWLTWRTESEAALRSSKAPAWFRARFPQWLAQGLARYSETNPKLREYRQCIVPMKANVEAAREEARQAALKTMERAS